MSNFRSQTMRDLAGKAPHCMACGVSNYGQVVGAHWRSLANGSGMGLKAPDLLAYVCGSCHDQIDQRAGDLPRAERELMYLQAFWKTQLWLLQEGHLTVRSKPARTA